MPKAHLDSSFTKVVRDAMVVVVGASCLGFAVNALRPKGSIPFVQPKPYDIVVPCAEPVGQANLAQPDDPRILGGQALVIDARSKSDFDAYHVPHAINVPFDWLGPPVGAEVTEVTQRVARSKAHWVIVYGDGDDPDSGREWARLLAGGGIKNVYYVDGGAKALLARRLDNVAGGKP
jgi:hypothetical protein